MNATRTISDTEKSTGYSLEDAYFHELNKQLVEKMRAAQTEQDKLPDTCPEAAGCPEAASN